MRCLTIAVVALLGACGNEEPRDENTLPVSPWSVATIAGVDRISDISVVDQRLYGVNDADDRAVYEVDLRTLTAGAELKAHRADVRVHEPSLIQGADVFASQGYAVKHVWGLPVAFSGIAVIPPRVYVAERNHRIIYWGELMPAADGKLRTARLDFAFSLRGGNRSKSAKSDWRDQGPGLRGLSAIRNARKTEDMYVVDAGGRTPTTAGVRRLDRTGGQLGATIPVTGRNGKRPDIRSVVWDAERKRFLALVGSARGALIPFQDATLRTIWLGRGTPGPKVDGVTGWAAMALDDRGRLFLVSEGAPVKLAWRSAVPE